MNNTGTHMLNLAREWFRKNPSQPIPSDDPLYHGLYETEVYAVQLDCIIEDDPSHGRYLPGCSIPVIAAIIEGVEPEFLPVLAKHGNVDKSMSSLVDGFSDYSESITLSSGVEISSGEIFTKCLEAIEAVNENAFVRAYLESSAYETTVTIAMTTAKSSSQWPIEVISKNQKMLDERLPLNPPFEASRHNCLDIMKEWEYPADKNGVRHDWLLERTGMLHSAVIRKTLGPFSLWEELTWNGSQSNNQATNTQGFVEYCLHQAPAKQHPAIKMGFETMVLETSHVMDGAMLLDWMKSAFEGTFLEGTTDNIILQMNMIRTDHTVDDELTLNPGSFSALQERNTVLCRLCIEIMKVPVSQMGMAHFNAFRLFDNDTFTAPEQILNADFRREDFICHLLGGLATYSPPPEIISGSLKEFHENCEAYAVTAVKLLSTRYDLDYNKFKDLSSHSSKILALAGLRINRLPRMSHRDRGRLLEQDLGM